MLSEAVRWVDGIRPWISTASLLGILGFAGKMWIADRKMKIEEDKADRDGYGVLIKALQEDVAGVRAEHRTCEERLAKIEGELIGFHRQALVASQAGLAILPASTMVREAGARAVDAIDQTIAARGDDEEKAS